MSGARKDAKSPSRKERKVIRSAYPRDIPGVPRERNLKGISFAVANMTGFVARTREFAPKAPVDQLKRLLVEESMNE